MEKAEVKTTIDKYDSNILNWADDAEHGRDLLNSQNSDRQLLKLGEEVGELFEDYSKNKRAHMIDSIGDVYITLTIFAKQQGISMEEALAKSWRHVKGRDGKMVKGTYIKKQDLNEQ